MKSNILITFITLVCITSANAFKMIVTSDVQPYSTTIYPRSNSPYNPGVQTVIAPGEVCEVVTSDISCASNKISNSTLDERMKAQHDHILAISPEYDSMIMNGDLTHRGLTEELNVYDTFYRDAAKWNSMPIFPTIGNHDYLLTYHQFDECKPKSRALNNDYCILKQLMSYVEDMRILEKKNLIRSWHANVTMIGGVKTYTGSLSYTWDTENYRFIALHYAFKGGLGLHTQFWSEDSAEVQDPVAFNVTKAADWLIQELKTAKEDGQDVVLVPHAFSKLKQYAEQDDTMKTALEDSSIVLIFSSHQHDLYGYWETYASKPVVFTGSSIYQKYVVAEFNKDGYTIQIADSKRQQIPCTNPDFGCYFPTFEANIPLIRNYKVTPNLCSTITSIEGNCTMGVTIESCKGICQMNMDCSTANYDVASQTCCVSSTGIEEASTCNQELLVKMEQFIDSPTAAPVDSTLEPTTSPMSESPTASTNGAFRYRFGVSCLFVVFVFNFQ